MYNFYIITLVIITNLFAVKLTAQFGKNSLANDLISNEQESISIDAFDYYKKLQTFNLYNSVFHNHRPANYEFELDSIYTYRFAKSLMLDAKGEFIFDSLQNRDIVLLSLFNHNTNEWQPDLYLIYNYNDSNLLEKYTANIWDGSYGDWLDKEAIILRKFKYNDNNQLVLRESQDWDDLQNNVVGNVYSHHYDSLGRFNKLSHFFLFSDLDTLTLTDETIYRYNNQNLVEVVIDSSYRRDLGWQKPDSTVLAYNEDGSLHDRVHYFWNSEGRYEPFSKEEYSYYPEGHIDEICTSTLYDFGLEEYRNKEKQYYSYHSFGSLHKVTTYEVVDNIPSEILIKEELCLYDESILYEEVHFPRSFNKAYYENHMIIHKEENDYDFFTGELKGAYPIFDYFYSPSGLSSIAPDQISEKTISLYPNPTSNSLSISVNDLNKELTIKIIDITGKIILKKSIKSDSSISVKELNSGIYFYSIDIAGTTMTGSFIKSGN